MCVPRGVNHLHYPQLKSLTNPNDAISRSIFMPKQPNGQCFWATIIEHLDDHCVKFMNNLNYIKLWVQVGTSWASYISSTRCPLIGILRNRVPWRQQPPMDLNLLRSRPPLNRSSTSILAYTTLVYQFMGRQDFSVTIIWLSTAHLFDLILASTSAMWQYPFIMFESALSPRSSSFISSMKLSIWQVSLANIGVTSKSGPCSNPFSSRKETPWILWSKMNNLWTYLIWPLWNQVEWEDLIGKTLFH